MTRFALATFAALMLMALVETACTGPRRPASWPASSPASPDAKAAPSPAAATSLTTDPLALDGGAAEEDAHAHHHHHAPAQHVGPTDGGAPDGR